MIVKTKVKLTNFGIVDAIVTCSGKFNNNKRIIARGTCEYLGNYYSVIYTGVWKSENI